MKNRHFVIIALVVNLIIRIPRMLFAHGLDGFLAIWEAQLILRGEYFKNGFNFLSLLGLTPYSGYPIGTLLLVSLFLLIAGKHLMISILLYDLTFTVIFVLCVYFLANVLELNKTAKLYFTLILTTLPNIFSFSYYQSSARLPFFALLPLVLAFLLKFNKEKKIKYLLFATGITILLNFIHRMGLIVFVIILLSVLLYAVDKLTKRDFLTSFHEKEYSLAESEIENENPSTRLKAKKSVLSVINYIIRRFWIFGIIGLYAIGFIVFGLNFENVYLRSKFNIFCYVHAIIDCNVIYLVIQPIADQWFHYGVPFLLFLGSLIFMAIPRFSNILSEFNKSSSNLKLFYFILPFILVFQLIYSYYFLAYIIALTGALLLQKLEETKYKHYLWPGCGILVGLFFTVYHFATSTPILPYLIIGLFLLVVSITAIILLLVNKSREYFTLKIGHIYNRFKIPMVLFIGILMVNSMFIVDRSALFTNRNQSIFEHITREEREIADFLLENGYGTFESFDQTVSIHIAALTGWYILQDPHNRGVFLLENRTVDDLPLEFTLFVDWPNMVLFGCDNSYGMGILYNQIFRVSCYSVDALVLLKRYNIRYFVSSRHTNTSSAWQYTINSVFIESLYSYVPIVKTTENYFVWNTSALYS
ncbi:MAG: hypothetical protein ACTSO7_11445 [Candidatus Heimdallarchaeota archaeon]